MDIWWRKVVTAKIRRWKPARLLDVASGTGDLAQAPIPSKWIDYGGVMFDFRIDDGRMFHVVISQP